MSKLIIPHEDWERAARRLVTTWPKQGEGSNQNHRLYEFQTVPVFVTNADAQAGRKVTNEMVNAGVAALQSTIDYNGEDSMVRLILEAALKVMR